MSNNGERDKQLVEIICGKCGQHDTITYGHYRRIKNNGIFYCKKCAQEMRSAGAKKYFENMTEEDHAKRSKTAAIGNANITDREAWKKKISDTKKAKAKENLTEEQQKIFGNNWDKIPYSERGKVRVPVTCKDCDKEFTVSYSQYRMRMKHSDNQYHWRCKDCRYAHHAELMREQNPVQAYLTSLSPEERAKVHKSGNVIGKTTNKKFEASFNVSALSSRYYLIPEFVTVGNDITKTWDFAICPNGASKPTCVVDIDGAYFHADNCDYDNSRHQKLRDENRFASVEDMKCYVIQELQFEEMFENFIKIVDMSYDEYLAYQLQLAENMEFPNPAYSTQRLINSYNQLVKMKVDSAVYQTASEYLNVFNDGRVGDALIYNFHYSMWSANVENRLSVFDAWNNREALTKEIKDHNIVINPYNRNKILNGFNLSTVAQPVSVFSASRAKMLIYKYLNDADTIYDPFSGFSGRMLGTVSLGKQYIGSDISPIHVRESNEIIDFLGIGNRAKVTVANVLQSSGDYSDCALFTCPPYGTKERWLDVPVDNRSCDDWITECLNHFKCSKYLFVIDKTEKYKEFIVDEIVNQSHFGKSSEYVILIPKQI